MITEINNTPPSPKYNLPDMLGVPRILYNVDGVRSNCKILSQKCAQHGISIAGVTKGAAGNPDIANAMLQGGISTLADSRLWNIQKLRDAGCVVPIILLRSPSMLEMELAAELADIFLLSDIDSIRELSNAKQKIGKTADIILMIELGDAREGIDPKHLPQVIGDVLAIKNARIVGIGGNHGCHLGVMPTLQNMKQLSELAHWVEAKIGMPLEFVSAGNSSTFALMSSGQLPDNINHLRLGEAILFGKETNYDQLINGVRQNNFSLVSQVIEVGVKSLDPNASVGTNALGQRVNLTVSGDRQLALLNIGELDTQTSGLEPYESRIEIIGASSDHLVADVTGIEGISVGDEIAFSLNYPAGVRAMCSPYLHKYCIDDIKAERSSINLTNTQELNALQVKNKGCI